MVLNGVGLEKILMREVVDVIYPVNEKMWKANALLENDKENQTYNKGLMVQVSWFQFGIIWAENKTMYRM